MKDINGKEVNIHNDCINLIHDLLRQYGSLNDKNAFNILENKFKEMRSQLEERTHHTTG
jgi:hypothetical protein